MPNLPVRLKSDCILEALVELRFDTGEPSEVVVGRLLDCKIWNEFARHRTPISDIPAQIRLSDPDLRFQPLYDLRSKDGLFAAKLGSHAISLHSFKKYAGWEAFKPFLEDTVRYLVEKFPEIQIKRIGVRYINATTSKEHHINSIENLNLDVKLGKNTISDDFLFSFKAEPGESLTVMSKIASPSFVSGPMPSGATSFIDIDVFTNDGWFSKDADEVIGLIEEAHTAEKEQFFSILPAEIIEKLEG